MPTGTFDYRSEAERIAIERAIAFVAEMHALAQAAPDGQVLPLCETLALGAGRGTAPLHLTTGRPGARQRRRTKKGAARFCACAGAVRFKRRRGREVLTAIGPIAVERSHGYCRDCEQPQFAADRLLGVNGWLTPPPGAWPTGPASTTPSARLRRC